MSDAQRLRGLEGENGRVKAPAGRRHAGKAALTICLQKAGGGSGWSLKRTARRLAIGAPPARRCGSGCAHLHGASTVRLPPAVRAADSHNSTAFTSAAIPALIQDHGFD